jgi:hypothetical protein
MALYQYSNYIAVSGSTCITGSTRRPENDAKVLLPRR